MSSVVATCNAGGMEKRSKYFGLNVSDHNRALMKRTGKTLFGHWLWTAKEDNLVRQYHPDFAKLKKLLRRRTMIAIKRRSIDLRLVRAQHLWTANEVTKLRRRWQDASREELIAEFPRHTWISIRCKGSKLGVHRRPWHPKATGKPLLDQIRNRAADLRISLQDLDRICLSREYFSKSSQGYESRRRNLWLQAIAALGGRVEIIWR
jgi:hypothetical protein